MGTDASRLWMDALAGLCVAAVVAALAWRLWGRQAARTEAQRVGATTRAVPLRHRPEAVPGAIPARLGGPQTAAPVATATRLLERDSR